MSYNECVYKNGVNEAVDRDFREAVSYVRVKLGENHIFWKKGLKWSVIDIACVDRVFRRVEEVKTKVCCGPANFDIQKLVLVLKDGENVEIRIGDGTKREAEELFAKLQQIHPELKYGK